jgi:uncharacterized damage-inducible protein DinB
MTMELDLIRSIHKYNSRVMAKYLKAICKLPPRARHRNRGASDSSLVDIFLHVLNAYRLWFDEVCARGAPPDWYPLGQRLTLAEARREMRAINRRFSVYSILFDRAISTGASGFRRGGATAGEPSFESC